MNHEPRPLDYEGYDTLRDLGASEGPAERPPYLGDIAISYDRAAEQAPEFGNSPQAEVATLLIHGLLHLLGYEDTQDAEHNRMHARQQELLEALYPPRSS